MDKFDLHTKILIGGDALRSEPLNCKGDALMDKFDLHTKILIGGDALRSMMQGMHRVFIVTDAFMAKSGRTAYLTDPIEQAGAEYRIYSEVGPDPDINMVTAGVSVIMEFQPDAVIAFGGGSPIDAAKAIMYFAARQAGLKDCPFIAIPTTSGTGSEVSKFAVITGGGSPIDAAKAIMYFAARQAGLKDCPFIAIPTTSGTGSEVSKFAVITDKERGIKYPLIDESLLPRQAGLKDCPFIAIPTTSGTGSEVSKFAVITDKERGIKYPLIDESLLPDYAVLDAELTQSVPAKVTADTGLDVLTHAIEAYVCNEANSFTDALAEKAIRLVYHNLLTAYREPGNLEARQAMHDASCMAGAAFSNAGLGLCHSMAHALGAQAHIPHGATKPIPLPMRSRRKQSGWYIIICWLHTVNPVI